MTTDILNIRPADIKEVNIILNNGTLLKTSMIFAMEVTMQNAVWAEETLQGVVRNFYMGKNIDLHLEMKELEFSHIEPDKKIKVQSQENLKRKIII